MSITDNTLITSPKVLNTFYFGTVVDNNDPLKLSRVRIRIPEIHGESEIANNLLPWAMQLRPADLGAKAELSSFGVPSNGTMLLVLLHRGDVNSPIYLGAVSHMKSKIYQILKNYPNSYGFKDNNGNFHQIDMHDYVCNYLFQGDTTLYLDAGGSKQGSLTLYITKDLKIVAGGKVSLEVTGDIKLTSGGDVKISALGKITLAAGDQISFDSANDVSIGAPRNLYADAGATFYQRAPSVQVIQGAYGGSGAGPTTPETPPGKGSVFDLGTA